LPLWNEDVWNNTQNWQDLLNPLKEKLKESDSYIFVVPEYSGSPSPSYSNFMLFLGQESNHKPVLIVTVSDTRGGAYPIIGVRAFGYKNTRINFIPEHIIVRNSKEVLNLEQIIISTDDQYLRDRIAFALDILEIYSQNFINIRKSIAPNPKFGNGMS
jgi:azobenzene reductase